MKNAKPQKKSHFKTGVLAGVIFGIAAGIFMNSKQGKTLAKQLEAQAKEIQKRLHKELKKAKHVSEDSYADAIENILTYYAKSKKIAAAEVPALRKHLLAKWQLVKRELKSQ
jgi:uncharacterized protein YktB (UPF0637 family)